MSWFAGYRAKAAALHVNSVNTVDCEGEAEEAAEQAAIRAERPLPLHGTAERERLDLEQAAMVAGLLKAAVAPCNVVRARAAAVKKTEENEKAPNNGRSSWIDTAAARWRVAAVHHRHRGGRAADFHAVHTQGIAGLAGERHA